LSNFSFDFSTCLQLPKNLETQNEMITEKTKALITIFLENTVPSDHRNDIQITIDQVGDDFKMYTICPVIDCNTRLKLYLSTVDGSEKLKPNIANFKKHINKKHVGKPTTKPSQDLQEMFAQQAKRLKLAEEEVNLDLTSDQTGTSDQSDIEEAVIIDEQQYEMENNLGEYNDNTHLEL
jgi:hypothetical protein